MVVYVLWRDGGKGVEGNRSRAGVVEEEPRITPREIYSGGNEIVAGEGQLLWKKWSLTYEGAK